MAAPKTFLQKYCRFVLIIKAGGKLIDGVKQKNVLRDSLVYKTGLCVLKAGQRQQMLQLSVLNSLYIHRMQLPVSRSLQTQPSIFQAILEECSSRQIEIEQFNGQQHQNQLLDQQLFKEQPPRSTNIWFQMDEVPFDSILDQEQPPTEDTTLQFHKVKSFREEQQTKIAQFLRDDKYKSLRNIEIPHKNSSPFGKPSQSLSPRKTKKIDKTKPLKIFPQSD